MYYCVILIFLQVAVWDWQWSNDGPVWTGSDYYLACGNIYLFISLCTIVYLLIFLQVAVWDWQWSSGLDWQRGTKVIEFNLY